MSTKYVISDTHINHLLAATERNMTVPQMQRKIIRNWNATVKPGDTVFHLGDAYFHNSRKTVEPLLNGRIIYIKGNHDPKSLSLIESMQVRILGVLVHLIHDPSEAIDYPGFVLHGHIHKVHEHLVKYPKNFLNMNLEFWDYRPVQLTKAVSVLQKRADHA